MNSRHRSLACGVVVTLAGGHSAGCAGPAVEVDPETAEGEAVLAALEHVAAEIWEEAGTGTTLVKGKAAVAYRGEEPLAESARGFLNEAFAARGWRWSTEDPLVPTGNCAFPFGDCRLKDPAELHLTYSMVLPSGEACAAEQSVPPRPPPPFEFCWQSVAGEARHGVHVAWLSSYYSERLGQVRASNGGEGMLVTAGPDGWQVKRMMWWIS
ncbi:MAG: hypothetical protein F4Z32_13860 [Gemmatimonadetes bacterium]|nr:hypothetical protein [Gemmatimonadota bacterium]